MQDESGKMIFLHNKRIAEELGLSEEEVEEKRMSGKLEKLLDEVEEKRMSGKLEKLLDEVHQKTGNPIYSEGEIVEIKGGRWMIISIGKQFMRLKSMPRIKQQ